MDKRHISVVLNAAEAVRSWAARDAIKFSMKARMYGLLPRDEQLAPYDSDRVLALFSPQQIVIPAHGKQPRAVQVVFEPFSGGIRRLTKPTTLELKREGIWKHWPRNRRIEKLAKALGGDNGLPHNFPRLAEQMEQLGCSRTRRVVVLVENIEHATRLGTLLPEWPIVAAPHTSDEGLSGLAKKQLRMGRHEKKRTRLCVIATSSGLTRAGNMSCVIRADAGLGLPPFPPRLITSTDDSDPLLLIDLKDNHHAEFRSRSRSRRQAYLEEGWVVDGKTQSALDRFLATRPKVQIPELQMEMGTDGEKPEVGMLANEAREEMHRGKGVGLEATGAEFPKIPESSDGQSLGMEVKGPELEIGGVLS